MIKLIVKAPNQKIADQSLTGDLKWSVKNLKDFLSQEYPSKPSPADQRLIYSGHLLRDEQRLEEVFSPATDDVYTLHLVCPQKQSVIPSSTSTSTPSGSSNVSRRGSSTPSESSSPTAGLPQIPAPFNAMLPAVNPALFSQMMMTGVNAVPATGMMPSPLMPMMMMWTPEQMAAVQQMYTQFVAQYQASLGNNVTSLDNNNQLNPEQVLRQRNVVVNNEEDAAPPAAAPVVEDDDEVENRDWLDWFYWMSRAIVLFSIVYFYSSFTRLALVFALAFIMYLYQAGVINPRNDDDRIQEDNIQVQGQRRQQREEQEEVVGEQIPEAVVNNNNNQDNGSRERSAVPSDVTSETERFSGLRMCWVIISSLFTSLIPDQAPAQFN